MARLVAYVSLEVHTQRNDLGTRLLLLHILLDLWKPMVAESESNPHSSAAHLHPLPFVSLPQVILLAQVDEVDHGLGGQKLVLVQHINLQRHRTTVG